MRNFANMCSACYANTCSLVKCARAPLRQPDELGTDLPRFDLEEQHGVERPTPPLGRRAGIQDPDTGVPLDDRQMRVPEEDSIAAREAGEETILAPGCGAGDMHHPD